MMHRPPNSVRFGVLAVLSLAALASPTGGAASAGEGAWSVDPEHSVVAVITGKAGLASGLAHRHLVTAPIQGLDLAAFDPARPGDTVARLVVDARALQVDDPGAIERWTDPLRRVGVLEEDLAVPKTKDRRKIEASMHAGDQLATEAHPEIAFELLAVRADPPPSAPSGFTHTAAIAMTLREERVEIPLAARLAKEERAWIVELLGESTFSAFGIEPYSALLGAIRVADRFQLYGRLVLHRVGAEE